MMGGPHSEIGNKICNMGHIGGRMPPPDAGISNACRKRLTEYARGPSYALLEWTRGPGCMTCTDEEVPKMRYVAVARL